MKRMISIVLSILAVSAGAFAQAADPAIEKALLPAPRQLKEGATVIKWKSDFTYDTLRKGTNRLVCYDRSGQPGQQPFAVECTSIANLDRCAAFDDAVVQLQDRDPLRDQGPFSELAVTGRQWNGASALSDDYLAIDGRLDKIRLRVELSLAPALEAPAAD